MNPRILLALLVTSTAFAQRPERGAFDAHLDQPYAGTGNLRQRLDLYLPKKRASDKPLPVVVVIHGGGWRTGDKAGAGNLAPYVASGEYAGISVGCRLSTGAKASRTVLAKFSRIPR